MEKYVFSRKWAETDDWQRRQRGYEDQEEVEEKEEKIK